VSKNFRQLDEQFEQFLDSVLIEARDIDLTEEKKAARRAAADKDDLAFCKIYFPEIFNLEWNELHRQLAQIKSGMWTVSGFRKCGKSAATYIMKAVKPICLDIGGIININCRTLDISQERAAAIKRLMFRNHLLCYDYDLKLLQDLKGYYIIGKTFLIAESVKTALRNLVDENFKRIRVAINDDLYNKDSVSSELDNMKVVDFIESEVRGQLEDGALSITMGNSISETCPIVQLKAAHPEHHLSLPALDENEESTWPEYKTITEWNEFKKGIPWDIWLGEYQDQPSVKGDVFEPEMLKPVNLNLTKIIASISVCDPSHGTSPAACDKAIVTGGVTDKRELIVEDIYIRKDDYSIVFDYVDLLRDKIPRWKCFLFENDFNQWGFAQPYYYDWMKKRDKTIPIIMYTSRESKTDYRAADKDSRILNLVHPHQTGAIFYSMQIMIGADWEKFKSQFLAYGKAGGKLDGLDALATLYIRIFDYFETGRFTPLKKRVIEKTLSWAKSSWR